MAVSIEGRNAIIEALRAGMPVRKVMIAKGTGGSPVAEVERLATAAGASVEYVARQRLDSMSERGAHQGIIALADEHPYTPLATVLEKSAAKGASLVVVLDHVTDPGNLGAVLRSAEVAGAEAVIVPKRRTAAVTSAAYKSSAGAIAWLPLVQDNLAQAFEKLKAAGYWIAGADASSATLAFDAPMDGRLVIVLGAEGEGLSRLTRERCDFLVSLPVAGHVDSLNVAQAATVLAFEWVRRTRGQA